LFRLISEAEELAWLEPERSGDQVGGELLDLGVEVADHSVVIAARVLDVVLDLAEVPLQRKEALPGLEIGYASARARICPTDAPSALSASPAAAGPLALIARLRASTTASRVPFS